jgi:hypothetical protein
MQGWRPDVRRETTNGSPKTNTRMNEAKPAAFGPAAMNAVTGVGAPS